jgi:hypothetical protein
MATPALSVAPKTVTAAEVVPISSGRDFVPVVMSPARVRLVSAVVSVVPELDDQICPTFAFPVPELVIVRFAIVPLLIPEMLVVPAPVKVSVSSEVSTKFGTTSP